MAHRFRNFPLGRAQAALAALLIITSGAVMAAAPALADPSAATQQFFGFSGGGGGSKMPESCDISKIKAQAEALNDQISKLNDDQQAKLKVIQDAIGQVTPGDLETYNKLEQEQTDLLEQGTQQLAQIKAQQDVLQKESAGPSDQCKEDLVGQAASEMRYMESQFNGGSLSSTMNKVDSTVAEIEALIPNLGKAGVNSRDIDTIKANVVTVKAASSTLRGFFASMSAQAAAFVAKASADPLGTYASLQSRGGGFSNSGAASAAADHLVTSFTNLVSMFDALTGTQGGK